MGKDAFAAAVACYRGQPSSREQIEGQLVCECFGVSDEQIRTVVMENNLSTVEQVTHYTKAGGGCGQCREKIESIISQVRGELRRQQPKEVAARKSMTNIQKIAKIQEVMEKEIRPMLQQDGGDVELIDLDGNRVVVALRGMCMSCPSADLTRGVIETKLKELVHPDLLVEEVEG
jgi:NifU-like protein